MRGLPVCSCQHLPGRWSIYEVSDYLGCGSYGSRVVPEVECTSAQTMRANQLRLYFASFAYALLELLRRWGLSGTRLARAQCGTIWGGYEVVDR